MDVALECDECGKKFCNTAGLFTHQKKKCQPRKRSLSILLSDARDYWNSINPELPPRKRPRLGSIRGSGDYLRQSRRTIEPCLPGASGQTGAEQTAPLNYGETQLGALAVESPINASIRIDVDRPRDATPPSNKPPPDTNRTTKRDRLGLFKKFLGIEGPSHDPDGSLQPSATCQAPQLCSSTLDSNIYTPQERQSDSTSRSQDSEPLLGPNLKAPEINRDPSDLAYYPYPNWSSFALGNWFWSQGVLASTEKFGKLIQILRHPDFKKDDICRTSWDRIHRILPNGIHPPDANPPLPNAQQWVDDTSSAWSATDVNLEVPFPNRGQGRKVDTFKAGVLHHRSIVSIIKEKMSDSNEFSRRHFRPYQHLWQPNLQRAPVQVYGEMYSSNEFLHMQQKVEGMALNDGPDAGLERVVLSLMFWSDATLLANFGTATLWPCYLFFGNDSKYERAKPSTNLCNHVAYFETLPDHFKDWYRERDNGHNPSQDLITYCKREIFHRQWDILLDDELVQAMETGIRILCPNNVTRLFFPWIFTYSADYPEKTLIGTVRSLGQKPCPRCLVQKCDLHLMGTPEDTAQRSSEPRCDSDTRQELVRMARSIILVEGYAVASDKVENLLKADSMLPIQNAFSRISRLGFDVYSTLVVDLMHEFELGVWKALFVHLIRILQAHDRHSKRSSVHELDRRYRQTPCFGTDTVRKFGSNASEQKRLGARDYENLLQCAIPAFDNLLPEPHNSIICRLLSICAEWHALAKLRLHTEETVQLLEAVTITLASQFNVFMITTCSAYTTLETPKEYAARLKRASKASKTSNPTSSVTPPDPSSSSTSPPLETEAPPDEVTPPSAPVTGKIRKTFNINTYKYHALADFSSSIRRFGTTDSYSTERGELEHTFPKSWFLRTDKKTFRLQLARIERRRANLRKIDQRVQAESSAALPTRTPDVDDAARLPPQLPYRVAKSQNTFKSTHHYRPLRSNGNDPALLDFLPKLQTHLLPRIKRALRCRHPDLEAIVDTGGTEGEGFVSIRDSRIYEHKTIGIGYTSYDTRQEEDIIRVGGPKATIMCLNPSYPADDRAHPFLYAKVHGIFHANVLYMNGSVDPRPERIDFLWVRWFKWTGASASSYGLHLLSFVPLTHNNAFGFLDPADVLRGCHLLPRFSEKGTILQKSLSATAQDADDHSTYFVNPFPDRDMYMRFQLGYAVGHDYTHSLALQTSLTPVGVLHADDQAAAGGHGGRPNEPTAQGPNLPIDGISPASSNTRNETHEYPSEFPHQESNTHSVELGEDEWVYRNEEEHSDEEEDEMEDDQDNLEAE